MRRQFRTDGEFRLTPCVEVDSETISRFPACYKYDVRRDGSWPSYNDRSLAEWDSLRGSTLERCRRSVASCDVRLIKRGPGLRTSEERSKTHRGPDPQDREPKLSEREDLLRLNGAVRSAPSCARRPVQPDIVRLINVIDRYAANLAWPGAC